MGNIDFPFVKLNKMGDVLESLVSIVITCYNYGNYIEACLSSAISQTYKNKEIIVIDDGSTDNTKEKVEPYIERDGIIYYRQDNRGQASAKNKGIELSKGDFIAFLDADDIWENKKIEKQIKLFNKNSIGVVYSKAKYMDENGNIINIKIKNKYLQPVSGDVTKNLFYDNFVPFSSSVVRKTCFENFGVFDESIKMSIDWDLWLRISSEYLFDFVDEELLIYRVGHRGQMSKDMVERERCSEKILKKYVSKYKNRYKKATIKKALFYSYCQRGYYMRRYNKIKSVKYYYKALVIDPFKIAPYIGIFKTIINLKYHGTH